MQFKDSKWDTVIEAKQNPLSLDLKQIIEYRDLVILFVRRDIAATYKQTILGPLWYLFQPVFTTVMFMIVFGHVARIGTDDIPPVLFYSIGVRYFRQGVFSEAYSADIDHFQRTDKIPITVWNICTDLYHVSVQWICGISFTRASADSFCNIMAYIYGDRDRAYGVLGHYEIQGSG